MAKFQKITSAGMVLLNPENKVLLVFKKWTKIWEYPQGARKENEDLLVTLKREVAEETGIKNFKLVKDFQTTKYYRFKRKGVLYDKTVVYFLSLTKEEIKLSEEHEQYRWCNFDEAIKLFKHQNHKDVLIEVFKRLKKPLIFASQI